MSKEEKKDLTKEQKLDSLIKKLNKDFGAGTIITNETLPEVEKFSSGSFSLDKALGGGWAKGRIIELMGNESSSKTSLALHAAAEVQKQGGTVLYLDVENSIDGLYAKALGVDVKKLLISQPFSAEDALEIADEFSSSGLVDFIVVDSVAALVPRAELEGQIGDNNAMGLQARLMSKAMRMMTGPAAKSGTTIMFINQFRDKLTLYGSGGKQATGGNSLKYYASQRVELWRPNKPIEKNGEPIGIQVDAKVIKNKCVNEDQQLIVYPGKFKKTKELLPDDKLLTFEQEKYFWKNFKINEVYQDKCFIVSSYSGREVCVNGEHPFLTPNGYIPISKLKKEDTVYLTKGLKIETNKCKIPPRLLAMLLSDGDITGQASLTITDDRNDLKETIRQELIHIGNLETSDLTKDGKVQSLSIVNSGGGHKGKPNKLISFLKEEGIWGLGCCDKFIPTSVFGESPEYKAEFILRYCLHDGSLEYNSNDELMRLNLYTSSPKLKDGLAYLLLSMGIFPSIRKRKPRKGGIINGRQIEGKKEVYTIRIESIYDLIKLFSFPLLNNETKFFRNSLKLRKPGNKTSESEYSDKNNLNFYKDKIKSITPVGEKRVYSIHIPGPETFDCGGFITHNCAPPFQKASLFVRWGKGVDKYIDVLRVAVEKDIITKSGAWFTYGDLKVQGEDSMAEAIKEKNLYEELVEKLK